ncbi:hypothetical protein [Candidatus Phycosocius spiralis]|uniref:hypothetical protein n=1 Tax=Candidatus Phycosocius spiralis TaxID=2815099 RepID=UPI0024E18683|nr:hypothetical protein [Candidatus Phycosocius spiralis]
MSNRPSLIAGDKAGKTGAIEHGAQQWQLDFGSPSFVADSFLISDESKNAREALIPWRTWPGGVMCLYGESGSGKSHLGTLWAYEAGAIFLKGHELNLQLIEGEADPNPLIALIDDADLSEETALFALLSRLEREGGAVLLLARTPPMLWNFKLPDLKSRLSTIVCETLRPPEQPLLARLIIRHAAAMGFKLDETSAAYLAARLPRTFNSAKAITLCMQSVTASSLKSPMALAQRALRVMYPQVYDDDMASGNDVFEAKHKEQ